MFSNETAYKSHIERSHNQKYQIQRNDSITKAPPNKKVKEHHSKDMETKEVNLNEGQIHKQCINIKPNDPNIVELPKQILGIVNEGRKENVVPGKGDCLIATTAAHTAGDVENTVQLARDLNTHIAMYRPYYLPKIQADFHLNITIGVNGGNKILNKGQEQNFFDWLAEAPETAFMWRGCMDIIALANMFRMDIDCIVHKEGTEPQLFQFSPEPSFPFQEEDMMRPKDPTKRMHPKITILN